MNIAELAIRNRLICGLVIAGVLAGGWIAYRNMARFEDPEFNIRTAVVITRYPGATAEEVAEEVTEALETAIQGLQEVEEIRSTSSIGLSSIDVDVKYEFSPGRAELEAVWTKLRHRVQDAQARLPPGAHQSIVNDGFGDVYGLYYLLTGDGFSPKELFEYAKSLRTELLAVDDMISLEARVVGLDGIESVQTLIGAGGLRYMLVYGPQAANASYGQLLLTVDDYERIASLLPRIQGIVDAEYPDAQAKVWQFQLGPGGGSKIEAEFSGPDPAVLRQLANEAKAIMAEDGRAISIKDDWREPVGTIQPRYAEARGRRLGISREDLANALSTNFSGRNAVIDAAASRVRPVAMSALTTMLGVIPLFGDAFFRSMAVVLVFGLGFATLLTLVVVPALYSVLFGVGEAERAPA